MQIQTDNTSTGALHAVHSVLLEITDTDLGNDLDQNIFDEVDEIRACVRKVIDQLNDIETLLLLK